MNPTTIGFSVITSCALALASPAQHNIDSAGSARDSRASDEALERTAVRDPSNEMAYPVFDQPGSDAIWVHGLNFKAKFDRQGFEFIPFLGSDAPHNYPIDFKIASARVGSTELGWQSDVQPELDGETVTFHRGAFDEIYVVSADSIEQNFVIRERRTSSDLHVVMHTDSELERAEGSLGIAFANERGGMQLGKASIRDALGREVQSLTRLVGESIEIVVPHAALEVASFPLAIDPVISTFQVSDSGAGVALNPDCAYDLPNDRWIVVYETAFSAADHDVIAREYRGNGTSVNQSTYIDMTTNSWTNPRVAGNSGEFLCVAGIDGLTVGKRFRDAASAGMGGVGLIQFNGATVSSPDVGGDADLTSYGNFVVVTRLNGAGTYAIYAELVSMQGAILTSNGFAMTTIGSNSGVHAFEPRITKQTWSQFGEWRIAFEDVGPQPKIRSCTLGEFLGSGWMLFEGFLSAVGPTGGMLDQKPAISLAPVPGNWLALCACIDTSGHVWGAMTNSSLSNPWGTGAQIDPVGTNPQVGVSLTFDGSRFVASYDQLVSTLKGVGTFMASVAPDASTLNFTRVDSHVLIGAGSATNAGNLSSICSMSGAGSTSNTCLCGYQNGTTSKLVTPVIDAALCWSH